MELLMISFAAAWVLRAWVDGRREDYRDDDNDYQRCGGRRVPRRSGPDTRYAVGWAAFQLRHGWPAMLDDVRRGYGDARDAYQAWRDGDGDGRPGVREAWRRGWRSAARKLPKTRRRQQTDRDADARATTEAAADTTDDTTTKPPPASAGIPPNRQQNGERMSTPTGETGGITAYREHLKKTAEFATQRIESAEKEITDADNEIAAHENSHAELGKVGMGYETTANVAELIEAAQARKKAAQDKLAAAERSRADAERSLADLDRQGHTSVEESVKGARAKVADTSFYEN